ncbi:MAG TPA: hypothetical protein VFZ56_11360 [Gemmatimonadaceae bacterium]
MRRGVAVCVGLLALLSHPAGAQTTGTRAFAIEAAGATAGSLLGFGVVYLARDSCGVEDLGCTIRKAGLGIGLSTVGAAAGGYFAGRAGGTNPSGWGSALGAVAGAAAGVGAWHLFTEELDVANSPAAAIAVYAVTQGLLTAAVSRLASRSR